MTYILQVHFDVRVWFVRQGFGAGAGQSRVIWLEPEPEPSLWPGSGSGSGSGSSSSLTFSLIIQANCTVHAFLDTFSRVKNKLATM